MILVARRVLRLCCLSISYIHYCTFSELRGVLEHPEPHARYATDILFPL